MAEMTAKIPISSVTKEMVMEIEVTGLEAFSIRLKIAYWLMWLAAKIGGFGFEIKPLQYSDMVKDESPIAYWKLDETSGATAKDSSGNNRDGTYSINTEGMITSAEELQRKLRERLKSDKRKEAV